MIEFSHVSKLFGAQKAVNDLNLNFQEGSFSVLIGTSGSGKSTTLKMINRLVEHDSGVIRFAGEEIRSLPVLELRRRMGYAIQSIGLFPHWSVAQNIATVPQLQKWSRARIDDRIDELMALLGLESNLRERYPHQLSGGQQQRVGVARALAADPQVLLMDEPFGALDPVTRGALQQEMTRIHRLLGRTIVLVTHDIDEALRLAEHLVLMDHGEVVQQGNPLTMLTRPANDFVRQFFGRSELGVRLLSLRSVADYVRREERAEGEALAEEMTLRDALSLFVARGCEVLPVMNTQGQPCGTLHFHELLEEAEAYEDVARSAVLAHCSVCGADFLAALQPAAVCCLVPTTATTRLSARKFCSSGTGSFLAGGNFEFVCGDHWHWCRNCCHSPVGRGISPTGGNYCRRWTDFSARRSAGDRRSGDRLWSATSDYRLDPLRCAARPAGDTCRAGSD